jgi:hypothetical protein
MDGAAVARHIAAIVAAAQTIETNFMGNAVDVSHG